MRKLGAVGALIYRFPRANKLFTGEFSYGFDGGGAATLLAHINAAAAGNNHRVVSHASLGKTNFIKFWDYNPADRAQTEYKSWHHYELNWMAPGYFLHNLMSHLANDDLIRGNDVWFPRERREIHLTDTLRLSAPALGRRARVQ